VCEFALFTNSFYEKKFGLLWGWVGKSISSYPKSCPKWVRRSAALIRVLAFEPPDGKLGAIGIIHALGSGPLEMFKGGLGQRDLQAV
jgi:hypothetical protein